jgi:hypothetical protein
LIEAPLSRRAECQSGCARVRAIAFSCVQPPAGPVCLFSCARGRYCHCQSRMVLARQSAVCSTLQGSRRQVHVVWLSVADKAPLASCWPLALTAQLALAGRCLEPGCVLVWHGTPDSTAYFSVGLNPSLPCTAGGPDYSLPHRAD